ncbi:MULTISPECIES: flagellar brake protein [Methylomonas]|uniref:Pilus assembly protein PilZ n=1 Tax=Methylomonas koyamae TaxID=702114 RepID=A0A177PG08_9GAMM|nr:MULTISPECIES: flagellar brake protein [Methylomonas]NJA08366.1 flagellar brake protein [Methylococcaceae bacterium WWC4]OAI29111.1 pilus assembly protein PilZ [Methylomonas koyamae]WGS86631.1 flagellar brake protein [Methylomonas sp. UP202]
MLKKLKQWFAKSDEPAPESDDSDFFAFENPNFLTDPDRIAKLLAEIETGSPLCTIQIEGCQEDFSSSILGVKLDKNAIILDELVPKHGNDLLLRSRSLKLSTFHKGIHLSFNLSAIEIGHMRGISYYKAPFPDRIFYPQRRRSPRLEIATLEIPFNGIVQRTGMSIGGYLFDLSRGGAGINIPANRARVQRGDKIKGCQIQFEDYAMDFDLIVRFVKPIGQSSSKVQIGGFFESLSSKSQSKLSYFITSLERVEIRKQKS